ncbi:MAG: hypothetical protein MHM6MM_003766 [Cercozoa sp. M6MM]
MEHNDRLLPHVSVQEAPVAQVEEIEWYPGEDEVETSLACPSTLACALSCLMPLAWCTACTVVPEKEERVLLTYGKYFATIKQPGCYIVNPCGTAEITVSTAAATADLNTVKVADAKGNPLMISAIVTYRFENTKLTALNVDQATFFVRSQALATLKRVASQYPYESRHPGEPSLKTEATQIQRQLVAGLQRRVDVAGARVLAFDLTDLAYAPEIAKAMLIRQQAEALVDARKIVVEGAVDIARGAVDGLQSNGIEFDARERARLVSNLLVVITSDSSATPTVPLDTGVPGNSHMNM